MNNTTASTAVWQEKISAINEIIAKERPHPEKIQRHELLSNDGVAALLSLALLVSNDNELNALIRMIVKAHPVHKDAVNTIYAAISSAVRCTKSDYNTRIKSERQKRLISTGDNSTESILQRYDCDMPQFVDLARSEEGVKKIATTANTEAVLNAMGITPRYNEMTRELHYDGTDDRVNIIYARIRDIMNITRYNAGHYVISHCNAIAANNTYHPAIEWIDSKPWDGVARADTLHEFVEADMPTEVKQLYFRKWMLGAVQLLYSDNPRAVQGMIVFQGAQGFGKTTFVESLTGDSGTAQTGRDLENLNVDSKMMITSAWISEIGEIDSTFRKTDISKLKAFITESTDKYRRPYEASAEAHPRRTAFFGTVNDSKFLADRTGNRRFWVIPVTGLERNTLDMQQVWAEIKQRYLAGEDWEINRDDIAIINKHNERFEMKTDYDLAVSEMWGKASDYDQEGFNPENRRVLRAKEIYQLCAEHYGGSLERLTMSEKRQIRAAMESHGWVERVYKAYGVGGKRTAIQGYPIPTEAFKKESHPDF